MGFTSRRRPGRRREHGGRGTEGGGEGRARGREAATQEAEETEGKRGSRGESLRGAREAEAGRPPQTTPGAAVGEERRSAEVPARRMVPIPHVRRRMAEASGRPIEVAPPLRLPMESPVDRIPRAAGGPGAAPERVPGDPRAQREAE